MPRLGVYELFNFETFDNPARNREGSDQDIGDFYRCIIHCVPQCKVNKNPSSLTSENLTLKLRSIASGDFTDVRYLLLFFSSHGNGSSLLTSDLEEYSLPKIIDHFKCDSLKDVPKIFVVQACRGETVDHGYDASSKASLVSSHKHAQQKASNDKDDITIDKNFRSLHDILPNECIVAFSTPSNRVSWRSKSKGGHFIQAFIKTLTDFHESGRSKDITKLLLATNQRIATQLACQDTAGPSEYLQIGEFISTLSKRLVL